MEADDRLLSGWGRTAPTKAKVLRPGDGAELATAIARPPLRGTIPRGLGRSYGDAAQNAGGVVVETSSLRRVLELDVETGVARVDAGMSLDELMRRSMPHGWFVPVTPGTRHVTIGGAIAADVHGKNHHLHGTFSQHVRGFDLLTADGEVRRVTPEGEPDLFWATAGGMGLTGIVLRATIQMI